MNNQIAIVGDPHLQGGCPRSRVDLDYLGTCLSEIEYIANLCRSVVFLGDFLHRPTLPNEAELRIIKFFMERRELGNRFYTTIGNHDVFNMNLDRGLRESKLSIIDQCGAVKILHHGERYVIEGRDVTVLEMKRGPAVPVGVQRGDIALAHYFFNRTSDLPMTLTTEMLEALPPADYFFGHDHEPYPPYKLTNGSMVYRPGSLARNTAQPFNLNRVPSFYRVADRMELVEVFCEKSENLFHPSVYESKRGIDTAKFRQTLDDLMESLGKSEVSKKFTIPMALEQLETPFAEREYLISLLALT